MVARYLHGFLIIMISVSPAMAGFGSGGSAFKRRRQQQHWPTKTLESNLALRSSAGLPAVFSSVGRIRRRPSEHDALLHRQHETQPDGSLRLQVDMPLLAKRYRYMHALSSSSVSQVICATDTYRQCTPAPDGRSQPLVAIKILNAQHWLLGAQEYERMRLLSVQQHRMAVDARISLPITHFEHDAHFCIVLPMMLEIRRCPSILQVPIDTMCSGRQGLLHPSPRPAGFTSVIGDERQAVPRLRLGELRQIAAQLLGALCFLRTQSVMHADIKPENIMLEPGAADDGLGHVQVRLIDFSNSMTLAEASQYHDTFDVQTLTYRAPEVIFGQPFSFAIDMWSLGITLAEFFSGRPLVQASSRSDLVVNLAQIFGKPPRGLFQGSKHAIELLGLAVHAPATLTRQQLRQRLSMKLGAGAKQDEQQLMDLLASMLQYDPASRIAPTHALAHAFFAPLFPFGVIIAQPKPEDRAGSGDRDGSKDEEREGSASALPWGCALPPAGKVYSERGMGAVDEIDACVAAANRPPHETQLVSSGPGPSLPCASAATPKDVELRARKRSTFAACKGVGSEGLEGKPSARSRKCKSAS